MKRHALVVAGLVVAGLCVLSIADNVLNLGRRRCEDCGATIVVVGHRDDDQCQATFYECPRCHRGAHEHEWVWERTGEASP